MISTTWCLVVVLYRLRQCVAARSAPVRMNDTSQVATPAGDLSTHSSSLHSHPAQFLAQFPHQLELAETP